MTRSLEELVSSLEEAEDPDAQLLEGLIDDADREQPGLGDAIRVCAIPRRFDADVLAALRGGDTDANQRLVERLARYPFVLQRGDGTYVYHEDTRDTLMRVWTSSAELRSRFETLNGALADFYIEASAEAETRVADVARLSSLLLEANPSRYAQIASVAEAQVTTALLEALYHRTLQGADLGVGLFTDLMLRFMARSDSFTWSLIDAMRRYLGDLPTEAREDKWLQRLELWEARLDRSLRGDDDAAGAKLMDLRHRVTDTELLPEVLDDVGDYLKDQGLYSDYQAVLDEQLSSAKAEDDRFELASAHRRIAELAWELNELERASKHYSLALEGAREVGNTILEISVLRGAVLVHLERGDRRAALESLLPAVWLSRTGEGRTQQLSDSVAHTAMEVAHEHDPAWLDAAAAEAAQDVQSPLRQFDAWLVHGSLLRAEGRLAAAEARCNQLDDAIARLGLTPAHHLAAAFLRWGVRQSQGRLAEARAVLDQLEESRGGRDALSAFDLARLESARGDIAVGASQWEDAERAYRIAADAWVKGGAAVNGAAMELELASVLLSQGRVDEAGALLRQTTEALGDEDAESRRRWYEIDGKRRRAVGDWPGARAALEGALEIAGRRPSLWNVALLHGELVAAAESQADWTMAARHARAAAEMWDAIAARDGYTPTDDERRSREENAAGVAALGTDGPKEIWVTRARDLFRSAADRTPGVAWYALNLACACYELDEWDEMADALNRAVTAEPTWADIEAIRGVRHRTAVAVAAGWLAAGRADEACRLLEETRAEGGAQVVGTHGEPLANVLGDALLALGKTDDAAEAYADAAELGQSWRAEARLGLAAASAGDLQAGVEHLRKSVATEEVGDQVADWASLLAWPARQPEIAAAAADLLTVFEHDQPDVRSAIAEGRTHWAASQYLESLRPLNRTPLPDQLDSMPPHSRPLVLAADAALFPQEGRTPEVLRMIDIDIPDMQRRVRRRWGVTMPGIRMRPVDAVPGGYEIRLDEIGVARGVVDNEKWFCVDAERCAELGIEGLPSTGPGPLSHGLWLDPDAADAARAAGLRLWDVHAYMLRHLEHVVDCRIDRLVLTEDVAELVVGWAGESPDRQALVERALERPGGAVRIAAVVRVLLRERVSVASLEPILSAVGESNPGASVAEIAEVARSRLMPDAFGDPLPETMVAAGARLEDLIVGASRDIDGRPRAVVGAEALMEARGLISELVDGADEPVGLIVETAEVRPYLSALGRRVHSPVRVFTAAEAEALAAHSASAVDGGHA